ncbi:sensor histidine kinase [Thermodesulfobacteriota bacterium]
MDKKRIKTEILIHDLKNPLAVIETGIESLMRNGDKHGPLAEGHLKVLRRALRNSKIAMSIVNDVLEVGRSNEGVIKRENHKCSECLVIPFVEIFDLMEPEIAEKIAVADNLSDLKNVLAASGIIFNVDDSLWEEDLFLDSRKVKQILRNLVSNAMKYREKQIMVDIAKDGQYFVFSIADDGCGIEEEYQERIFEKYFQLEDERNECLRGHGLGLAGALILVEDMGGEITLTSDKGRGASFEVRLPLE